MTKTRFEHIGNMDFARFYEAMEGRRTMVAEYDKIGVFHLMSKGSGGFDELEKFVVQPSAGVRLLQWYRLMEAVVKQPIAFADCFGRKCMLSYDKKSCQVVLTIRHDSRSRSDVTCHPSLTNRQIGAMMR
jgi:hypothetical protein